VRNPSGSATNNWEDYKCLRLHLGRTEFTPEISAWWPEADVFGG
jgi:hypothetical protein